MVHQKPPKSTASPVHKHTHARLLDLPLPVFGSTEQQTAKQLNKSDHHPSLFHLLLDHCLTLHCVAPKLSHAALFSHLCCAELHLHLHCTQNHFLPHSTSRFCLFGGYIPRLSCLALPLPYTTQYPSDPIGYCPLPYTTSSYLFCTYHLYEAIRRRSASSFFLSLFRLLFRAGRFTFQ